MSEETNNREPEEVVIDEIIDGIADRAVELIKEAKRAAYEDVQESTGEAFLNSSIENMSKKLAAAEFVLQHTENFWEYLELLEYLGIGD